MHQFQCQLIAVDPPHVHVRHVQEVRLQDPAQAHQRSKEKHQTGQTGNNR